MDGAEGGRVRLGEGKEENQDREAYRDPRVVGNGGGPDGRRVQSLVLASFNCAAE